MVAKLRAPGAGTPVIELIPETEIEVEALNQLRTAVIELREDGKRCLLQYADAGDWL